MPSTEAVVFSQTQIDRARHAARTLRKMAAAARADWCPVTIAFYERYAGKKPVAEEVIAFSREMDREIDRRSKPFCPPPEPVAFSREESPVVPDHRPSPAVTHGGFDSPYYTRRPPESPAPAPAPTLADRMLAAMSPAAAGVPMPPPDKEPEQLLGFTDAAILAAESVGLDLRGRAAAELAGLAAPGSAGVEGRYLDGGPTFRRNLADRLARRRAILRRVAGGLPVDGAGDEVDSEVAAEVVPVWYLGMGRGVGALAWYAPAAIAKIARWAEQFASSLLHAVKYPPASIVEWCDDVKRHDADRRKCEARVEAIRASAEALPGCLAARVAPVVEAIGGPEKLLTMLREASVESGAFPGPDEQLDRLQKELDEATTRMGALCPPSGEEPGELYATALARHDELADAVRDRKAAVKKAASDKIRGGIAALLAGVADNHDRLLATVRRNPEAFPPGFGESLDRAGLEAVVDSGPLGWFWAL